MYPRIVRQMAFIDGGALGEAVVSSILCKSTGSWLIATSLAREASAYRLLALGSRTARAGSPLKLLRSDSVRADIRPQCLRNNYASIRLLIVLDDRDPCATHGQCATVEGMNEFSLVLAFGPIANICAPCLIGFEIRARRYLAIQILHGQPHL